MEHDPRMTIAAQATGINYYDPKTFKHYVRPVPPELLNAYIPPQYVGRPLPAGAFKSLWPNGAGIDWNKNKPENWTPDWRPPFWTYRPELYEE